MTQRDQPSSATAERDRPVSVAALATLFDLAPFGVWIADAAGALVYMNSAGAALLALEPGDVLGATVKLAQLCDPNGTPLPANDLPLARALRGEAAENVSFRLRTGAAEEMHLGFSYGPTKDGGAFICAGDRTAERQLERARDDFLAAVAHDLRSPLTSIRGSAQLAQRWASRNVADADLLAKCLANIDSAASRLNRMLQTLMDSARVERGGLTLQAAPADLVAIVNDVVAHHQLESRRHSFSVETPAEPLVGHWDAALLERAVENLIGNAVKYSPDGGPVSVICAATDGEALLVVRDRGVGIPAEALPYIFDRFYRANQQTVGEIEGNGLGLFAVRGIVTAHGGTIAAQSVEGEGSELTVRLPLANTEQA
jgi:two-component system, OmpR family, phosphate regulon sensor histidine kinase PhoR